MHYYGSTLWNNLSPSVKTITSLYGFKKRMKSLSFSNAP